MQILIVDDEPLILDCISGFLSNCGHDIICAGTAEEAMNAVRQVKGDIDLVISDVCMPGANGTALLQNIRNYFPEIDVVLITGFANAVDATGAVSLGACAFLQKPVKIVELEVIVNQIEKNRHQRSRSLQAIKALDDNRVLQDELLRNRIFARRLHNRIFPRDFSWLQRSRAYVRHLPMASAGGDYIDMKPYGDGRALVIVADVCGHGIPAAFGGIALKTWFSSLPLGLEPQQILSRCDGMFDNTFPEEFYATAFCAIYDEESRELQYCIAGHPAPVVLSAHGNTRMLSGDGGAIGIGDNGKRVCMIESIQNEEVVIAYTDGLTSEPMKLWQRLSSDFSALNEPGRKVADLHFLIRHVLDTAVKSEPLRAFSDDLSIIAFGPSLPKKKDGGSLEGRRCLIIDDDETLLRVMSEYLKIEGMEVRTCNSAINTHDDIAAFHPDVIAMDINMPHMSGIDALSSIRESFPHLPVLMLSGDCTEKDAVAALEEKITSFLCKPVSMHKLVKALQSLMEYRPEVDTLQFDNMTDAGADWFDFVISSSPGCLDILSRYIEALGRQPIPHDVLDNLVYCIREIGGNAIEWGNRHNPNLKVRISTIILPDRVIVKIRDEGTGFDPRKFLENEDMVRLQEEREAEGKRDGGFGLSIVQSMMDSVTFNKRGNAVVMTKFFVNEIKAK